MPEPDPPETDPPESNQPAAAEPAAEPATEAPTTEAPATEAPPEPAAEPATEAPTTEAAPASDPPPASFADFKDSFFYGPRTDLNFKFLEHLSEGEAADFFEGLLKAVVRAYDGGDRTPVLEHVRRWQVRGYAGASNWTYDDRPLTPLDRPLGETTVALVASTGHFVEGDDPAPFGVEGMTQEQAIARVGEFLKASPRLSEIPLDTPRERLRARHPGYDVEGVRADPNVALPLERFRELEKGGEIGGAHPTAWSFVGACAQTPLVKKTGPEWVARWKEEGFQAALLVPV